MACKAKTKKIKGWKEKEREVSKKIDNIVDIHKFRQKQKLLRNLKLMLLPRDFKA